MHWSIRNWMVGTFLLGALAFVAAPASDARDRTPYESRMGTVVYLNEDHSQIPAWKQQVERDKQALREDIRSFGENSAQARADRVRLALDQRELERVKKNLYADRHFVQTKHYLWRQ